MSRLGVVILIGIVAVAAVLVQPDLRESFVTTSGQQAARSTARATSAPRPYAQNRQHAREVRERRQAAAEARAAERLAADPERQAEREARARAARIDHSTVTLAEYSELEDGMSYWGAVVVIGFDPVEISRVSMPGGVTRTVQWMNDDGSSATASFRNDYLIQKLQVGLR